MKVRQIVSILLLGLLFGCEKKVDPIIGPTIINASVIDYATRKPIPFAQVWIVGGKGNVLSGTNTGDTFFRGAADPEGKLYQKLWLPREYTVAVLAIYEPIDPVTGKRQGWRIRTCSLPDCIIQQGATNELVIEMER